MHRDYLTPGRQALYDLACSRPRDWWTKAHAFGSRRKPPLPRPLECAGAAEPHAAAAATVREVTADRAPDAAALGIAVADPSDAFALIRAMAGTQRAFCLPPLDTSLLHIFTSAAQEPRLESVVALSQRLAAPSHRR